MVEVTVWRGAFNTLSKFVYDFRIGRSKEVIEFRRPRLPTVFDRVDPFPSVDAVYSETTAIL